MDHTIIYPAGRTDACTYAAEFLQKDGFTITDHPMPEITHLLLDAPLLHSCEDLTDILSMLPENVIVSGGNLNSPPLQTHRKMDFLTDPYYLTENAAITAECAVRVVFPLLRSTLTDTPVLILGWGRIGKALAFKLKALGCNVTVAARKNADRALIRISGIRDTDYLSLPGLLPEIGIIFNTVPYPVLSGAIFALSPGSIKVELASVDGLAGENVIIARGLPGRIVPKSSGRLIADTFRRLRKEEL